MAENTQTDKERTGGDKAKLAQPHWSTFVAPTVSIAVALLSLCTTIYIFRATREINRATLRPYLTIAFIQQTQARSTRVDGILTNKITTLGYFAVRNVGSSPAYDVELRFRDAVRSCTGQTPFGVFPNDTKVFRTVCSSNDDTDPNKAEEPAIFNVQGRLRYTDGFTAKYDEEARIQVCTGPLDSGFVKLNRDPYPHWVTKELLDSLPVK